MKKIYLRVWSIILCMLLLLNVSPVYANTNNTYDDLPNYCPYNEWAVKPGMDNKIIFLEDIRENAQRWEIASLLYYICKNIKGKNANLSFNDLETLEQKYIERIKSVSERGLILGYEDGTFKPFEDVTRAEFVAMIARTKLLNKITNKSNNKFEDILGHWAESDINVIYNNELVSGKEENKFCPDDYITIQEVFVILDRMVKKEYITKSVLIDSLINTFACKQYGEEEAYVIETIYSKYDDVCNNMKYYWGFEDVYDTSVWNGYATYEDLLKIYNVYMGKDYQDESDSYLKKKLQETIDHVDLDNSLNEVLTFKDLIYTVQGLHGILGNYKNEDISILKFTNIGNIEDDDAHRLAVAVREGGALENVEYYIPFYDIKVSRFMLTCIFYNTLSYVKQNLQWCGYMLYPSDYDIETDISKMPYNYDDYTYIIDKIPNNVYEQEYRIYNEDEFYTPKECYRKYIKYYNKIFPNIRDYFNTILNVDYNTIDEKKFATKISNSTYNYIDESKIQKYVQYVKDNKIIIKGSAYGVAPCVYLSEISLFARVVANFEIVSADENKNLLFGDFLNKADVVYKENSYNICFDIAIQPKYDFRDSTISGFYIDIQPVIRNVYWNDDSVNEI